MAEGKAGQVTLRGRFPDGTKVALVEVKDETVLRAEGGKTVDRGKVKDGVISFPAEVGKRYLLVGNAGGSKFTVRVVGREKGDESAQAAQAPVQPDRLRFSGAGGGGFVDEAQQTDKHVAGTTLALDDVSDGTPLMVGATRGQAFPVQPHQRRIEDSPADEPLAVQADTGQAFEARVSKPQTEVKGKPQRIDTPVGQAYPIVKDDDDKLGNPAESKPAEGSTKEQAEKADAREREAIKALHAEPNQETGSRNQPKSDGWDAQGQPLDAGQARVAGVEPATGIKQTKAEAAAEAEDNARKARARTKKEAEAKAAAPQSTSDKEKK